MKYLSFNFIYVVPIQHSQDHNWVRYPAWEHTFVSPSAFLRRAVVSYWRKYVHEVLVNPLGGISLPRKSVVRLTDRPDMTLDVYSGRKTTKQQTTRSQMLHFAVYQVSHFRFFVKFTDKQSGSLLDY